MKRTQGFTLMELMIVVAVIAILASIGFPSYQDYVTRSKIAEATSALSDGRVRLEQYFQDNRTYVGGPKPANTSNFTYTHPVGTPTATGYTLTATGAGSMTGFTFTINQANEKRTTAAPTSWFSGTLPATCWVAKKGASC
jgi:type IV pilus assembly protein PilE